MRLDNLDKENGNDMTWMSEKSFMVFLSLENVDQISSLDGNTCDVKDLILSLLLMIWWVWNFELLLVPLIIDLHKPKLREAVFKANTIQSDAPNLNSDGALTWSSWIDTLEERLLDDKLFHSFFHMGISL